MGGTEGPCYEINPVMFCADDENCGHVHLDIVDVYEEMPCDGEREYYRLRSEDRSEAGDRRAMAQDCTRTLVEREPVGVALARAKLSATYDPADRVSRL